MSDSPLGDDWWQASDRKWYPPREGGPPGGGGRWSLPLVLLTVVALLAAGITFVLTRDDDMTPLAPERPLATVVLEPAGAQGPVPFTDSVSVNEVTEFPETVEAVVDELTAHLRTDELTGTLVATGDTPGLYGGTRNEDTCDATALTDFLTDPANATRADAWAEATGIAPGDIASFIGELTSSVLTLDTRVTNHGFRDGRATPRQSVLQAGTAVLVDSRGVPRVRCSCGNPLAEPEGFELAAASERGTAWSDYDAARTVTAQPATASRESLTLVDIATGDTYQASIGHSATWVATVGGDPPGTTELRSGGIYTSEDGSTWEMTLESPEPLNAVAHGDGRFVAVGGSYGGGGPETGVIYTSADGQEWSEPTGLDAKLVDVAHGNGTWVVVSGERSWTSTDGETWTEQPPFDFEFDLTFAEAIAFGDGRFLLNVSDCGGSRCWAHETWTSTNGVSWTVDQAEPSPGQPEYGGAALGFASTFASVGIDPGEIPEGGSHADQEIIPSAGVLDGDSWARVPLEPSDLFLEGLTGTADGWLSVGAQGQHAASDGVWASSDLSSWTRVATVAPGLSDIAVSTAPALPPPEPQGAKEPEASDPIPEQDHAGPTGEIDFSSPLLGFYDSVLSFAQQGEGAAWLANDVTTLSEATGMEWTEEMVMALAASECNDWDHGFEHHITAQGRADWAAAIAPVLGIPLEAAVTATSGDPQRETAAPCD